MRHKDLDKKVFVNIHVDDILLACLPGDVEWFKSRIGAESRWAPFAGQWRTAHVFEKGDHHER